MHALQSERFFITKKDYAAAHSSREQDSCLFLSAVFSDQAFRHYVGDPQAVFPSTHGSALGGSTPSLSSPLSLFQHRQAKRLAEVLLGSSLVSCNPAGALKKKMLLKNVLSRCAAASRLFIVGALSFCSVGVFLAFTECLRVDTQLTLRCYSRHPHYPGPVTEPKRTPVSQHATDAVQSGVGRCAKTDRSHSATLSPKKNAFRPFPFGPLRLGWVGNANFDKRLRYLFTSFPQQRLRQLNTAPRAVYVGCCPLDMRTQCSIRRPSPQRAHHYPRGESTGGEASPGVAPHRSTHSDRCRVPVKSVASPASPVYPNPTLDPSDETRLLESTSGLNMWVWVPGTDTPFSIMETLGWQDPRHTHTPVVPPRRNDAPALPQPPQKISFEAEDTPLGGMKLFSVADVELS